MIHSMNHYTPTAESFFSGAGGLDLGMTLSGVQVLKSLDLDPKASKCMSDNSHYFPHEVINGNIEEQMALENSIGTDIILGTWPCKKYSTTANVHGTRTGDHLYLHFFRMLALKQPEMYVVENVPGMKKFKIVMEAISKMPGYYMNIFCPLKTDTWLPQTRDRLILIGTKKPFSISEPSRLKNRPKIKDILEKNPDPHYPDYVTNRLLGKGGYRDRPIIVDPSNPDSLAPTCVAHYSKDVSTRVVKDKNFKNGIRPFTVREYARLQGFPDDFKFENVPYSYELIGNAVPVHMGMWIGEQATRYFNQKRS